MTSPETRAHTSNGAPVKSAERVVRLLEYLAHAEQPQTLTQLSTVLDIPKSSLHGLLRTLETKGWTESDSTGFKLGLRVVLAGSSYVDADVMVQRTSSILDSLVAELNETVHHGRLDGSDIVYLAKRDSTRSLRLYSAIGRRLPAHATALGKAILADRDFEDVRDLLPPQLPTLTPQTIDTFDKLHQGLAAIRQADGLAVDREENTSGIYCYALSIGRDRPRQDAISCSVPVARLTKEHESAIISALRHAQAQLV